MPKLIPPSPGRVVWYFPSQHEIDAKTLAIFSGEPLPALVAYVHSDRLVNLALFDHAGAAHRRTSVTLLQEDDETPHTSEGPYATWMPYQLGQAEKAAETAGKFVDVGEYQGKAPEGAGIGTLSGGSLAAAQGFTGANVAQQAEQLQAGALKVAIDPAAPGADKSVEFEPTHNGSLLKLDGDKPAGSLVAQVMADAKQLADAVAGLPPEAGAYSGNAQDGQAPA